MRPDADLIQGSEGKDCKVSSESKANRTGQENSSKHFVVIGGMPRCGKTSLAESKLIFDDAITIHGDEIRREIEPVINCADLDPHDREDYLRKTQKRDVSVSSEALYRARQALEHADNVIVEGIFWPHNRMFEVLLNDLGGVRICRIFLATVHTDPKEHADFARAHAMPGSTIDKFDDEELLLYAEMDLERTELLRKEFKQISAISRTHDLLFDTVEEDDLVKHMEKIASEVRNALELR